MSSEPPPWASAFEAAPPLSRRRVALLVVAGLLVVALVVAIVTLRSALDAVVAVDDAVEVTDVSVDIDDCADQFPEWIEGLIDSESRRLQQLYGSGPLTSTSYRHPDGFPTVAITWAGVIPNCGTTLIVPDDIGVAYYLDASASSRSQFEAVSSMLTTLGYVMTADEGPRELLEVGDGGTEAPAPAPAETGAPAPDGPVAEDDGEAEVSGYRYFRLADGTRLWVQFDPDDASDPDGTGDLYLGYFPPS